MIELLTTIFLLLLVYAANRYYLAPVRRIHAYVKAFSDKGYRVHAFPYHPLAYPIIQTIYADSAKGDAFHSYKKEFSSYDVLVGNQLSQPSISLLHPELRKQFARVERDFVMEKLQEFTRQQVRFAGRGLIFSEGETWKKQRRTMGALFTHDLIRDNVTNIQRIYEQAFRIAESDYDTSVTPEFYQFELSMLASRIFSESIVTVFMGLRSLNQTLDGLPVGKFIIELANDANMQAKGLLPLIFGVKYLDWGLRAGDRQVNRRLRLFNQWVSDYISKEIEKCQANKVKASKSLISLHLTQQSRNQQKNEGSLSEEDVKQLTAELKNFTFAGNDTSVNFFRMIVLYLSQNPQAELKLRQQIERIVSHRPLNLQILKELKYLEAVQKQTTRMYGPTNHNFPRRVLKDYLLDGIPISRGTIIQYHTVPTHYNPEYYHEPFEFRPERWLSTDSEDKYSALLVGFGLGPRACIGQHLALVQSKIAIVKFYQRYAKIVVPTKDVKMKWKFLYKPDPFDVQLWVK